MRVTLNIKLPRRRAREMIGRGRVLPLFAGVPTEFTGSRVGAILHLNTALGRVPTLNRHSIRFHDETQTSFMVSAEDWTTGVTYSQKWEREVLPDGKYVWKAMAGVTAKGKTY